MPVSAPIPFEVQFAMDEILRLYSHRVRLDTAEFLQKQGSRSDVATTEVTIAELKGLAHENLLTTNGITHAISANAGADQVLEIEGKTISSGLLTFDQQSLTLNGQTAVALTTPIARIDDSWNEGALDSPLTEDVTFYEGGATSSGVVTDNTEIHAKIMAADDDETEKCATSIADGRYWIITLFGASILSKTSAAVDFKLQTRKKDKLFRPLSKIGLSTTGTATAEKHGPFIITPNSDTRVTAKASTGSAIAVEAFMKGYMVSIV